ncbi:hypothetical protein L1987_63908 [Smallanthus sonchifolius]|uniref:Uncharacterized protein n=1 Tax=Smallanthus sonchifolius TaxID=185202 RepID=A0ACB9CEL5_9ASTR|nr:hypothetical protein L1987_63908 [Smallanthus sonchifolius]
MDSRSSMESESGKETAGTPVGIVAESAPQVQRGEGEQSSNEGASPRILDSRHREHVSVSSFPRIINVGGGFLVGSMNVYQMNKSKKNGGKGDRPESEGDE